MGGDTVSIDDDDVSTVKQQFPDRFIEIATSWPDCSGGKTEKNESVFRESDTRSFRNSSKSLEIEANDKRKRNVYAQVFKSYDELNHRIDTLEVAKSKILSYTPGSWVENVGGTTMTHFDVPKTTTLLLVGPKGSGKSSLINRISCVFEDDKFAPERAQVTYNSFIEDGTCYLQEYMIPRNSSSFCLYDTHSFSDDLNENSEMIKSWMTKGVTHGEFVKSYSLSKYWAARMKRKSRQDNGLSYEKRPVNYVIFVVNGLSILKCVDSDGADTKYIEMVAGAYNSPYISFKDHKPAIAITHGDLLSLSERARVRVYLGKRLGVHPSKQTFDIPDNSEPTTELTIVDLLRYTLEHADRNLPLKIRYMIIKAYIYPLWECLPQLLALVHVLMIFAFLGFGSSKVRTDNVPEANLDIKDVFANNIPEANADFKNVFLHNIPDESFDINKVFAQNVPEEDVDLKKDFVDNIPEEKVDIKKVFVENIPEENVDKKKVFVENIKKPNSEKKKVNGERINKRSVEKKKVRGEKI